jgi:RNA polymerase sigma factor (sigma-70 family)
MQKAVQATFSFSYGKDAEELLAEALPLAIGIAGHYVNAPGSTLDELRAEARLAAWDAARTFDPSRGKPFEAYVGRVVRNRLKSLFRKDSTRAKWITKSLDFEPDGEDSGPIIDSIPGKGYDVRDAVCLREVSTILHELINELPDRHRQYVRGYMNGETDSATARKMGITKQSLHAIKMKAIAKLRAQLEARRVGETPLISCVKQVDPEERKMIFWLSHEELVDLLLPDLRD